MGKFLQSLILFLLAAARLACLLAVFTAAEFVMDFLQHRKGQKAKGASG